jgi:hypothetical protein
MIKCAIERSRTSLPESLGDPGGLRFCVVKSRRLPKFSYPLHSIAKNNFRSFAGNYARLAHNETELNSLPNGTSTMHVRLASYSELATYLFPKPPILRNLQSTTLLSGIYSSNFF